MSEPYEFPDFNEHAQNRAMWLGSKQVNKTNFYKYTARGFIKSSVIISDALPKCVDEIITNAVDQYVTGIENPDSIGGPVSHIKVTYNTDTGEITIYNNGHGMHIYMVTKLNKWSVQSLATREFGGQNMNDKKDTDRITGGINGVGMKAVVSCCTMFKIETVDVVTKLKYTQRFLNGMTKIEEPVIIPITCNSDADCVKNSYTKISFIPNYELLCDTSNTTPWFTKENSLIFEEIIRTRLIYASAYIGSLSYRYNKDTRINYPESKHAKIYFQNKLINIHNVIQLANCYNTKMHTITLESNDDTIRFPWVFSIGLNPGVGKNKIDSITLLNGMHLPDNGNHIDKLVKNLVKSMQPKMGKMDNIPLDALIRCINSSVLIINSRPYPLPQLGAQSKNRLTASKTDLTKIGKTYKFPDNFINTVWLDLKERINVAKLAKEINEQNKIIRSIEVRYCEPARMVNVNPDACYFICMEGNSAQLMIEEMLTSPYTVLNKDYAAIYSLQGVPPNALKQIDDSETSIVMSNMLRNNVTLWGLANALGLVPGIDYSVEANFKHITHKAGLILATDQDMDGIGHICSMVLIFFVVFWPSLIKRGFIKRLATPIIRVELPNSNHEILEFFSESEYEQWNKTHTLKIPADNIVYYKGLSGHEGEQTHNMSKNIFKNLYTYTWDESTKYYAEIMYGKDSDLRKQVLITPVCDKYTDEYYNNHNVTCTEHFNIESKSFQLESVRRKLRSYIDGFIPAQRKAICAARTLHITKKTKVFQITGKVTDKMAYQHGDTSMNNTISLMAQCFPGSNNIPVFVPVSVGFGGRKKGRDVIGSPRYTSTMYNKRIMDLIFPPDDDYILPYEFEEGKRVEPLYYVPIIPYSILETSTTPGTGWKIDVWARDFDAVISRVKTMIKYNYPDVDASTKYVLGQPSSLLGHVWKYPGMRIVIGTNETNYQEICLGNYKYNENTNTVEINQLPLKMWSHNLLCNLVGKNIKTDKTKDAEGNPYPHNKYVADVHDDTNTYNANMRIKLKPDSYDHIIANEDYVSDVMSPIEKCLGLYQILHANLNMIGADGIVKEFTNYEDVLCDWFIIRRNLYEIRIKRQKILSYLRIKFLEEMLRFINMDNKNEIIIHGDQTQAERNTELMKHKFIRFNQSLLERPKYTNLDDLERLIIAETNDIVNDSDNENDNDDTSDEIQPSYKYIDKITIGMKSKKGIERLQEKLNKLQLEHNVILSLTWQNVWLEEINKIKPILDQGMKTHWMFENKEYTYTNASNSDFDDTKYKNINSQNKKMRNKRTGVNRK